MKLNGVLVLNNGRYTMQTFVEGINLAFVTVDDETFATFILWGIPAGNRKPYYFRLPKSWQLV